jgi:hypothetical protein
VETRRRRPSQQLIRRQPIVPAPAAFLKGSAAVSFFSSQAFELAAPVLRPRAGAVIWAASFWGLISMKSDRPDNPDPIPLRSAPPRMGTIMIRFVGLLVVAVVALALVWSR